MQFKVGATKTRDGRDAIIYALNGPGETPLVAAVAREIGTHIRYDVDFFYADGRIAEHGNSDMDLMPNAEFGPRQFWLGRKQGSLFRLSAFQIDPNDPMFADPKTPPVVHGWDGEIEWVRVREVLPEEAKPEQT
jgi:hypothetical protein